MGRVFKRKRYRSWYIRYTPHTGRSTTVKGLPDYDDTVAMMERLEHETKLIQEGYIDAQDVKAANSKHTLLAEYAKQYEKWLTGKGRTANHAKRTRGYIETVCDEAEWETLPDIDAMNLGELKATWRKAKMGARAINARLVAVKAFTRWLWRHDRVKTDPLATVERLGTDKDPRHPRRAMTEEEVRGLLSATHNARKRYGMTGPVRAMLYRLAVETGARANELRTLTRGMVDLEHRTMTVLAAYAKNGKEAALPLRRGTTEALALILKGLKVTDRVFDMPIPSLVSKMLRADLKAAGITYRDDLGRVVDFHALRHTCGSMLAAKGVHPRTVQTLMRHSDINVTMKYYTHTYRDQETEAVEALPDFGLSTDEVYSTKIARISC